MKKLIIFGSLFLSLATFAETNGESVKSKIENYTYKTEKLSNGNIVAHYKYNVPVKKNFKNKCYFDVMDLQAKHSIGELIQSFYPEVVSYNHKSPMGVGAIYTATYSFQAYQKWDDQDMTDFIGSVTFDSDCKIVVNSFGNATKTNINFP